MLHIHADGNQNSSELENDSDLRDNAEDIEPGDVQFPEQYKSEEPSRANIDILPGHSLPETSRN
jgi:hypothetical protein